MIIYLRIVGFTVAKMFMVDLATAKHYYQNDKQITFYSTLIVISFFLEVLTMPCLGIMWDNNNYYEYARDKCQVYYGGTLPMDLDCMLCSLQGKLFSPHFTLLHNSVSWMKVRWSKID